MNNYDDEETAVPELSEMDRAMFLQRLRQLQTLCSSSLSDYPQALLFVPGPDGRGNKGGSMFVKYLFQFATGKELFEGSVAEALEPLEEAIFLIQEHSVSIVMGNEARAALSPYLPLFPFLVEYTPATNTTEEETDEFQARKCADFKRMMIQSVPAGAVVGVPVPLGYDSVLDIENWALMRSFAMESVVRPTGFFTARYTVIDLSEVLDFLFRSVDAPVVGKALQVMQTSVLPHVLQSIGLLSGQGTNESRSKLTADDIASPLDFLNDFGELESVYPPDPTLKPSVLLGPFSMAVGSPSLHSSTLQTSWRGCRMAASNVLHAVTEGYEPSSGMRWCRTYFLRRGRVMNEVADPDALVSSDDRPVDSNASTGALFSTTADADSIDRLEAIYLMLWTGLRSAARDVFAHAATESVLDMAAKVESYMQAWVDKYSLIKLASGEKLKLHMDCINGVGQVCPADEVQDIGGQCWVYIRAAVHGIQTGSSDPSEVVAVAVGDTFLYSPFFSQVPELLGARKLGPAQNLSSDVSSAILNLQDSFCITHSVPYWRVTFGTGQEEAAVQRFLQSTRSMHMLPSLGLGSPIEAYGSNSAYTFPLITDLSMHPFSLKAELNFFDDGFLVQSLDGAVLPSLVSFNKHVSEMWTIDIVDCVRQAESVLTKLGVDAEENYFSTEAPEGLVVIFKLKGSKETNPFGAYASRLANMEHVGFVIRTDSNASSGYYNRALLKWKRALRMNDIVDHKGAEAVRTAPAKVLSSLLALCSVWSIEASVKSVADTTSQSFSRMQSSGQGLDALVAAAKSNFSPRGGYFPLMGQLLVAEAARLHTQEVDLMMLREQCDDVNNDAAGADIHPDATVVVVAGHTGSAVPQVASLLISRLGVRGCKLVTFDLSGVNGKSITDTCRRFSKDIVALCHGNKSNVPVIVVSLTVNPIVVPDFKLVIDNIVPSKCRHAFTLCVVDAAVSSRFKLALSDDLTSSEKESAHFSNDRLGSELLSASVLALCRPEYCDAILCIDGSANYTATSNLKSYIRQVDVADSDASWELAVYRVKPPALWIDDELVDRVSGFINRLTDDLSKRNTVRNFLQLTNPLGMSSLHAFSTPDSKLTPRPLPYITPKEYSSVTTWYADARTRAECDVQMILICMKHFFPSAAYVSTTLSLDVWRIPEPTTKSTVGSIQRAFQLAWAKTARKKILESNRKRLGAWLEACDPAMRSRVQAGLYGCSVYIPLPSGMSLDSSTTAGATTESDSCKGIMLDATPGYIVFRVVDSNGGANDGHAARISITGLFKEHERDFVDTIFSQCFIRPFDPRPKLNFSDLTQKQLVELQQTAAISAIPLPSGWWFDGDAYVDIYGTRRALRPDIEAVAQVFLAQKNGEIDRYNDYMSEKYP